MMLTLVVGGENNSMIIVKVAFVVCGSVGG